jgi:hypothetical protein
MPFTDVGSPVFGTRSEGPVCDREGREVTNGERSGA